MTSFTGEVVEKGEKNGAPFFIIKDQAGSAKIWVGREYKGDVPNQGESGTIQYGTEQPEGFKYPLKKLEGWELSSTAPATNGSHPSGFVGRDPGSADYWTAARWALSAAIDKLGPDKTIAEYAATAKAFLAESLDMSKTAKGEYGQEAKKSEDF